MICEFIFTTRLYGFISRELTIENMFFSNWRESTNAHLNMIIEIIKPSYRFSTLRFVMTIHILLYTNL